ncbi:MAG: hypothetical protein ACLTGA_12745 [Roseburia sp.]
MGIKKDKIVVDDAEFFIMEKMFVTIVAMLRRMDFGVTEERGFLLYYG